MKSSLLIVAVAICIPAFAQSKSGNVNGPDCAGGWPTNMTFVEMKNPGWVDNNNIDSSKTKTVRLASQKIGKDLWHQVYRVTLFKRTSGEPIDAIAVHDASTDECSMSGVEVFVVSEHLNAKGK